MNKVKKAIENPYILYTVLFLIAWSIITLPFELRGNSLIGESDSFNQSFPVFIYIGEYIRGLFQGEIKQFDFCIGLGDDVITALNWHGFGDIFQIASVLFSPENAEIGYEIVMVIKYYCCGIAFLVFCRSYLKENCFKVAGALMYTFSVFALFWGLNCWMFLNPMITLPLILTGIDQTWEKSSCIHWIYVIAIFIQSLNGFYFLYMEAVISIVYFGVMVISFFYKKQYSIKKVIQCTFSLLSQGILGCMMGGIMLVPAVLGYLSSSRAGNSSIGENIKDFFVFKDWNYYLRGIANILVTEVYKSTVTLPAIVILGVLLLIVRKQKQAEVKIITIVMMVAFWIPIIGKIMNGFSYWVDRWFYAVILFMVLSSTMVMENNTQINRKEKNIFWILTTVSIVLNFMINDKTLGAICRNIVLLSIVVILPFAWNARSKRNKILLVFSFILVIINGLLVFGPTKLGGSGYSAGFKKKGESYEQIVASVEKIPEEKDGFARVDVYESSLASSLVMSYFGTTEYFSMINSYVSDFYRELYISPGVRSATWILKGLDGRQELESLLAVSDYMDNGLKKNKYPFSLAFCINKSIGEEEFSQLSPLQKENVLIKAVVLGKDSILQQEKDKIKKDEIEDDVLVNVSVQEMWDRIRVYIDEPLQSDGEYYVRLKDFVLLSEGTWDVEVGNKSIQLRNQEDNYYMGETEFWVHMSEFQEREGKKYFDIVLNNDKKYMLGGIEVYFHQLNYMEIEERRANSINTIKFSNNKITGTVVTGENDFLVLSVPYSKGWTAYVDGVKTSIIRADIAFMAIIPGEGMHNIELRYETPGLKLGMVLSIVGIGLALAMFIKEQREQNVYEKNNETYR